ncbi:MAG: hypothetical protein WBI29_01500 [Candidatus Saccharimonadales bacterium]
MLKKIIIISSIIALVLLTILLNVTNPASAGPFGILILFVSTYVVSVGLITGLICIFSKNISRLSFIFMSRRPIDPISLKNAYYYSTVISLAPIMLIGLNSVGAGSFYSTLLVIIFESIGVIYVSKVIR